MVGSQYAPLYVYQAYPPVMRSVSTIITLSTLDVCGTHGIRSKVSQLKCSRIRCYYSIRLSSGNRWDACAGATNA